jgi:flagellar protein FlaJ
LIPELAFFSYRLFGQRLKLPSPKRLEENLKKAALLMPADVYLSFVLLISLIVFAGGFLNGFIALYTLSHSLTLSIPLSLLIGVSSAGVGFASLYFYPSVRAGRRRREIEANLPYVISTLSILSAAGVPADRAFRLLASLEKGGQIRLGGEAALIYRDLTLLGGDLISVLKEAAERKVSTNLSTLLEGIVATIRSGGDLTTYLQEEGRSFMRLQRSILRELLDFMVIIAEIFIALLVAFPLILIVMLVVMSSLGGGVGAAGPATIVPLVIYGLVPAAGILLLILLDLATPKVM